ncbi:PPC domain-containing protein [Yoonia sp. 2307UL14-13]|uniref:PPC domain-containing protein n=1 Tax=Yoonia sp. 2307UL14-13 TaxID=3126506 RepID=UPI0030A2FAEA
MTLPLLRSAALTAATIGFAVPALAQANLCGGSGANGIWIGGDEATSDITTVDNFQEQMALILGGNDYVSLFSLSEGTDIRVEAAGRGAGDPIIDLLGEDGSVILSDDDSGGDAASRAETFLDAGTYCLSVRSYDGGPMTAFVRIGRAEQDALTEGIAEVTSTDTIGSCGEATDMGGLGSTAVATPSENGYLSFTLDASTPVTITAENEEADPTITLYDGNESYIDENDDYDGLNSQIDVEQPLDPGIYCIEVGALSDETLPITVSVTEYDPEAALMDIYARGEAAPPLDGSIPVTDLGALSTRARQDVQATADTQWFTFDVEESGLVLVEAIAAGDGDPWLIVFDDLGREVGQNDDYGAGFDSLVSAKVEPGTYIVGVKHYDESAGLIRLVLERYVRAR